jgi:hypothetical protein
MLSLPSDSMHRMQLLEVMFFNTLTTYMASAIASNLKENSWQRLSTEHIASLVGTEFSKAATMETAMNGFRNRGLWPVDRCVFTDDDFVPSMVTNRPGQPN